MFFPPKFNGILGPSVFVKKPRAMAEAETLRTLDLQAAGVELEGIRRIQGM